MNIWGKLYLFVSWLCGRSIKVKKKDQLNWRSYGLEFFLRSSRRWSLLLPSETCFTGHYLNSEFGWIQTVNMGVLTVIVLCCLMVINPGQGELETLTTTDDPNPQNSENSVKGFKVGMLLRRENNFKKLLIHIWPKIYV